MASFVDHIVNQRFKKIYEELEHKNVIKGKSDIAKQLGTYNHVVNSILKGQRNITVDQLQKLFEIYGIDANYVFGLSDDMFRKGFEAIPTRSIGETEIRTNNNITLVPAPAMAGYAFDLNDTDYIENLQQFSIPGLFGEFIAFEISGDSMLPTITNGDIIVCELIEREVALRDNNVYVIVTDSVVAKRIQQIKEGNTVQRLRLISDNDAVYKPYEVDLQDIRQILKVKCRLTSYAIS